MALRYLGRKMGVPALRQLATTPRRLASSSWQSSSHQGCHNNGARVAADAWKPLPHADDVDLARRKAEFAAECEEAKNRRLLVGSCFTGVGLALLLIWYTAYTEWKRDQYFRSLLE